MNRCGRSSECHLCEASVRPGPLVSGHSCQRPSAAECGLSPLCRRRLDWDGGTRWSVAHSARNGAPFGLPLPATAVTVTRNRYYMQVLRSGDLLVFAQPLFCGGIRHRSGAILGGEPTPMMATLRRYHADLGQPGRRRPLYWVVRLNRSAHHCARAFRRNRIFGTCLAREKFHSGRHRRFPPDRRAERDADLVFKAFGARMLACVSIGALGMVGGLPV